MPVSRVPSDTDGPLPTGGLIEGADEQGVVEAIDGGAGLLGRHSATADLVRNSRLLVVDDQLLVREMIRVFLMGEGFTDIHFAVDGLDALDKVESVKPDIVILDLFMPNLDGREVCKRLRESPATATIPILVQTASDDADERAEMFLLGATDLVSKPLNRVELTSRIRIHLENRHLIHQLEAFRTRMNSDLAVARTMQHAMMPDRHAVDALGARYGLRISAHFETSEELGGDMWSIAPHSDRAMMFSLVDFSGHGVVAALNTFRFQTMAMQAIDTARGPLDVTNELNEGLCRVLARGQFATAIVGIVDIERDRILYVSCGAPNPLLALPGDTHPSYCASEGLPLGISKQAQYQVSELAFPPGSTIFLFSDAVLESPSIRAPALTEQDLAGLVGSALEAGRDPVEVVEKKLSESVRRPLPDDLTLLCIRRPPVVGQVDPGPGDE